MCEPKSTPLPLTEPTFNWTIGDDLVNSVITAAVWSEGQRPGIWQGMIRALSQGAAKTKEGTANAFLFRAMLDSLLAEFHALEPDQTD